MISVGEASGAAIQRCADMHTPSLLRSVGNLFLKREGKRGVHAGSGVFVRLRGCEYFLTAAHVSCQQGPGQTFFVGGFGKYVPLDGRWSETESVEQYEGDPLDIAVLAIHPHTRAQLSGVEFLEIGKAIHRNDYKRSHRFMLMGYPRSQNKRVKAANSLPAIARTFVANPKPEQQVRGRNYVMGRSHLVLEWDENAAFNAAGYLVKPTALPGLSGGPIFEIGDYSEHDVLAGLRIPQPTFAGIATDHLSNQNVILGTRINLIVDALDAKRAWPPQY